MLLILFSAYWGEAEAALLMPGPFSHPSLSVWSGHLQELRAASTPSNMLLGQVGIGNV